MLSYTACQAAVGPTGQAPCLHAARALAQIATVSMHGMHVSPACTLYQPRWPRKARQGTGLMCRFRYGTLTTEGAGRGVTIYVVDSGVRISHNEFQPWTGGGPSRASYG